jgi:hypothetical protein
MSAPRAPLARIRSSGFGRGDEEGLDVGGDAEGTVVPHRNLGWCLVGERHAEALSRLGANLDHENFI